MPGVPKAQNSVQWSKPVSLSPSSSLYVANIGLARLTTPHYACSCKTCERRGTPCLYRDFIRHRRKKHEYPEPPLEEETRPASPQPAQPQSRPRSSSVMNNFPNSVSATHMASPSCPMQLYYGATSHFSLMQHIYRDLVSNPTQPGPSSGVDEAGAGLELFSFRRM